MGKSRSGMGIDCADLDNDGIKTRLSSEIYCNEQDWLYKQRGKENFVIVALRAGIATPSDRS